MEKNEGEASSVNPAKVDNNPHNSAEEEKDKKKTPEFHTGMKDKTSKDGTDSYSATEKDYSDSQHSQGYVQYNAADSKKQEADKPHDQHYSGYDNKQSYSQWGGYRCAEEMRKETLTEGKVKDVKFEVVRNQIECEEVDAIGIGFIKLL